MCQNLSNRNKRKKVGSSKLHHLRQCVVQADKIHHLERRRNGTCDQPPRNGGRICRKLLRSHSCRYRFASLGGGFNEGINEGGPGLRPLGAGHRRKCLIPFFRDR
uniref:(northern house mosquito) hypothetical protein n=1 Tax=Culex pipiens TaxID=7175 RepID=A0A8D8E0U1_CULPI